MTPEIIPPFHLGNYLWAQEVVPTFLGDEHRKRFDIRTDDIVRGFECFKDSQRGCAIIVIEHFLLSETGALHEEIVHETMLLSREVLDSVEASTGEST